MAAGGEPERITEAEVQAFAQKLEEWGSQLPEGEQALLRMLVSAAEGTAPEDVAGYMLNLSIGGAASASLTRLIGAGDIKTTAWGEENGPDWINSPPPLHLP
jgi:hypothetical protein